MQLVAAIPERAQVSPIPLKALVAHNTKVVLFLLVCIDLQNFISSCKKNCKAKVYRVNLNTSLSTPSLPHQKVGAIHRVVLKVLGGSGDWLAAVLGSDQEGWAARSRGCPSSPPAPQASKPAWGGAGGFWPLSSLWGRPIL